MSFSRSRAALVGALLSAVAGFGPVGASSATTPLVAGLKVLPPGDAYAGLTLGEWFARSWQWTASIPRESSPHFDPTGERCGWGQSGPVFFLPSTGSGGNVRCVVPEGMALLAVVAGFECSTVDAPPNFGRNEDELRSCASVAMSEPQAEYRATLNGQEVPDVAAYRTSTPLFTFNFPQNNIFGLPAGGAQSVADGYAFIIAPPPPGEYHVVLSWLNPAYGDQVADLTVVVQPSQVIEPGAAPQPTNSIGTSPAIPTTSAPGGAPVTPTSVAMKAPAS